MKPAESQPRGSAQRSRLVIRLIACFRLLKGLALVAVFLFEVEVLGDPQAKAHLHRWIDRFGGDPESHYLTKLITWLISFGGEHLQVYEALTLLYAGLFLVEAVALFLGRRWAEWLVVISTALLIPLECWRMVEQGAWRHAWVVAINLAIVVYLFRHVRLRVSDVMLPRNSGVMV